MAGKKICAGRLDGQIAIVTGAAQGIGAAIVRRFIAEGATVVCIDRDDAVKALAQEAATMSQAIVLDVGDLQATTSMIGHIHERHGRIDILVNNAGIDGTPASFEKGQESEFDELLNVNLRGCWGLMRSVLPIMAAQSSGSIINMASVAAMIGYPTLSIYSASKAGLIGMTRSAAAEYGPVGVRVNTLCPGGVLTKLSEEFADEATLAKWAQRHALRRFAEPDEIAAATAFLASHDASFITGAIIPIDGGLTAG